MRTPTGSHMRTKRFQEKMIDWPSCDKIFEAIKYLKDKKGTGSDSIAAELLKSGGPSLMNALNKCSFGSARHYMKAETKGCCSVQEER
jgi:hypothetical protein